MCIFFSLWPEGKKMGKKPDDFGSKSDRKTSLDSVE